MRDDAPPVIRPAVGDGLRFGSRNYHALKPSRGGRRIARGFSLRLADDTGDLLARG